MALTTLTFCNFNGQMPVIDAVSFWSQSFVPDGTNQQSDVSDRPFVRVGTDVAVFLAFGANPDAGMEISRVWQPANSVDYYRVGHGVKVSVVAA